MIYKNVDGNEKPEKVSIENLPDGKRTIRLADNVEEYRQPDEKGNATGKIAYHFDEVVFDMPDGQNLTQEDLTKDFAKWWEYGQTDHKDKTQDTSTPTDTTMTRVELTEAVKKLQEQGDMIEECLMEMSEKVYA